LTSVALVQSRDGRLDSGFGLEQFASPAGQRSEHRPDVPRYLQTLHVVIAVKSTAECIVEQRQRVCPIDL
jgi:hypothetical protein